MTRVQRLLDATGLGNNEAVAVYKPANLFYLTGFTGEGIALLGRGKQAVITDFRYVEQAERECKGFEVHSIGKGQSHEQLAATLVAQWGVQALRYEDDGMTVRIFEAARRAMPQVSWQPLAGEAETLRQIKDEGEIALIERACRISSESFERILPEIREGMTEQELAVRLEFDMLAHGADKLAFSTIAAAGANGSLPHACAGRLPRSQGRYDHLRLRRESEGLLRGYDPHGRPWRAERADAPRV